MSVNSFQTFNPTKEDLVSPVKLLLVTGSVVSGVGKGIISSSLGVLLKANGYRVSAIKIDPYINIDAGTFSPYEHGEVFVLDDGGEVDLDLGNYERFLNVRLTRDNNITTGKIYNHVIERERQGKFLGKTVQTVPHVTDAIIEWIERVAQISVDGTNLAPHVCIIELGGTIGDVESMPYTKAFSDNLYKRKYRDRLMCVHVTQLITLHSSGEVKTKPAQNGIQKLRETGLFPDLVMCRSEKTMTNTVRDKILAFSQVDPERIIDVYDVSNIYQVPLLLERQNVLNVIQDHLKLEKINFENLVCGTPNMIQWKSLCNYLETVDIVVKIALVGKYVSDNTGKVFEDAYASVVKALHHAAVHCGRKLKIEYIKSETLEVPKIGFSVDSLAKYHKAWKVLKECSGIVVPGGFGSRGFEGIIAASQYARENKIPYLGICLGLQCAAVEFARNVCNIPKANSTEFAKDLTPKQQVVIDMPEHNGDYRGMGGTMRLGKRNTVFLTNNCTLKKLYNDDFTVSERHRHRYEVNPFIVPLLSENGLLFVGMGVDETNIDGNVQTRTESSTSLVKMAEISGGDTLPFLIEKIKQLCVRGGDGVIKTAVRMEMCEMKDHPYFVGVQYHPEYLSHPLKPSPPFFGLLLAASNQLESFLNGVVPSPAKHLNKKFKNGLGLYC